MIKERIATENANYHKNKNIAAQTFEEFKYRLCYLSTQHQGRVSTDAGADIRKDLLRNKEKKHQ